MVLLTKGESNERDEMDCIICGKEKRAMVGAITTGNGVVCGDCAVKRIELSYEILRAYGHLHDMLSDMIEGGELVAGSDHTEEYKALVDQLSGPCMEAMHKAKGETT